MTFSATGNLASYLEELQVAIRNGIEAGSTPTERRRKVVEAIKETAKVRELNIEINFQRRP